MVVLPGMARLVPPRVISACLRTQWNGWVTGRRFQVRDSRCIFGCLHGCDSIEHYAHCAAISDFAWQRLGLVRLPDLHGRLAAFLLLQPRWCEETAALLARRALLTACVYLTHCWYRHSGLRDSGAAQSALRQQLLECVRGHPSAGRLLNRDLQLQE